MARTRADEMSNLKRMMILLPGRRRAACGAPPHPAYLKSTAVLSVLLSAIFESLARTSRSQRGLGGGANGFICVRGLGIAAVTTPFANFPLTTPDSGSLPHPRKNQTYGAAPISFGVSLIANRNCTVGWFTWAATTLTSEIFGT